ncbi:MAG: YlmC/YmxH family sporulation protein [Clostridia bacterium]|nr:YlmC/YmxH family sporulation protein [Clostridia bacterium]
MEETVGFTNFRCLEKKEVVNTSTGERLGFISDAELDMSCGEIRYFIVPVQRDPFCMKAQEWRKFAFSDIEKIGDDIILISRAYPCVRGVKKKKILGKGAI